MSVSGITFAQITESRIPVQTFYFELCLPQFKITAVGNSRQNDLLTSITCKGIEHVICRHIWKHLENLGILTDFQHGFRKRSSC